MDEASYPLPHKSTGVTRPSTRSSSPASHPRAGISSYVSGKGGAADLVYEVTLHRSRKRSWRGLSHISPSALTTPSGAQLPSLPVRSPQRPAKTFQNKANLKSVLMDFTETQFRVWARQRPPLSNRALKKKNFLLIFLLVFFPHHNNLAPDIMHSHNEGVSTMSFIASRSSAIILYRHNKAKLTFH